MGLEVGGRKGWRTPKIEELLTLVDVAHLSPALPPTLVDLIQTSVLGYSFWSATNIDAGGFGPGVMTMNPQTGGTSIVVQKESPYKSWCVRGGTGYDRMEIGY
jgi:hypothetical protein